jgi:hypothetical protein
LVGAALAFPLQLKQGMLVAHMGVGVAVVKTRRAAVVLLVS